jgi:hypothetical protein
MRFLVVFVFVLACAPAADAAHGVVDLSWDQCSPVVSARSDMAGIDSVGLIVSVQGNDQAHSAYQVHFQLGAMDDTVPDAWRFDTAGCQVNGSLLIYPSPMGALSKVCPAFQGTAETISFGDCELFPAGTGYPTTLIRGRLVNYYPSGQTAQPAQRYFLAEFRFDHSHSVNGPGTPGNSCGGLEVPIVIRLLFDQGNGQATSYLSGGMEFSFEPGNTVVTANDAVPATPATWGQIKSQYRR